MLIDPYPAYRRLQRDAPVHWAAPWNGWVVSDHGTVSALLRDGDWSTSRGSDGRLGWLLDGLDESRRADLAGIIDHYSKGMRPADPLDHTRIKNVIKRDFAPRAIDDHRKSIRASADDLLDGVRGLNEWDVIERFAYPLPTMVLHRVMGFPLEDVNIVTRWGRDINAAIGSNRPDYQTSFLAQKLLTEARAYIRCS